MPPPFVPRMVAIEVFLANELMKAILVTVAGPAIEESIQAPDGPILSIMGHPLGSNI